MAVGSHIADKKKHLSCLADFGCYGGWRLGVNLLKKVKVCGENLFSDSVEWSDEKCKKMVAVDIKTNRNKKLVAVSFYKK